MRLRDKFGEKSFFIRQSVLGHKYYVDIDGVDARLNLGDGDAIIYQQVKPGYEIEVSASDFEDVRIHSPLDEHLIRLKNKTPSNIWNDSFELAIHLPYLNWRNHPLLLGMPKHIRDEVVGWIEGSIPEYQKKVIDIAKDKSLSNEKRVEKLRELSRQWVKDIGLREYLEFVEESSKKRKELYAEYSEPGKLPSWANPQKDLHWIVDLMHPIAKEDQKLEHKWLIEDFVRIEPEKAAELVHFFRENPEKALDFSNMMSELGSDTGTAVLDTLEPLDFFVRADRMAHRDRMALYQIAKEVVSWRGTSIDKLVNFVCNAPFDTVHKLFRAVADKKITQSEAEDFILSPYFERSGYPQILTVAEVPTFVKALAGYVDEDVRAWARIQSEHYLEGAPGLKRFFDRIADHDSGVVDVQTSGDNVASILWYPRYPGGHYSWTHTKIVVDGTVYGTMGQIEKFKPIEVHDRKARASLKDSYFKFDLQVTQKELENLMYLMKTEQRFAVDGHWGCVQGTCGTFQAATAIKIPRPFNQLPSLTALYLAARNQFGDATVKNIEFVGKSKFKSLLSPDIAKDALTIALQPPVLGTGFILALVGGTLYVVNTLEDKAEKEEEERKAREERFRIENGMPPETVDLPPSR